MLVWEEEVHAAPKILPIGVGPSLQREAATAFQSPAPVVAPVAQKSRVAAAD
jgi:hypothetical protein